MRATTKIFHKEPTQNCNKSKCQANKQTTLWSSVYLERYLRYIKIISKELFKHKSITNDLLNARYTVRNDEL